ncbi:MAG: cobyrinate a,c-diamide synthase [Bacteroidales bacterium]|nr:cobyrinate a,c-diamide synthase [Bacteroidales bacterium]
MFMVNRKTSAFMLAAPSSGSGKTTVSLGLMRLLSQRGQKIQPFKCGPDYIDGKHHYWACGNPSVNLDLFFSSEEYVRQSFHKYTIKADVCIVEAVMGLFDGASRDQNSSASIAKLLNLPVIMVINAGAMAYTAAAILFGFKNFDKNINLAGVIFNNVGSKSHYGFLKEAAEEVGVTPLGYVLKDASLKIPERHLGLAISLDNDYEQIIENIAHTVSQHIDLELLLEKTQFILPGAIEINSANDFPIIRIAVARDEAFNFSYIANLEKLQEIGDITYFSPIHDEVLPEADLVYLAGGYPELFMEKLSQNTAMRSAILAYCKNGGRLLAECGGMMYMSKSIIDTDGREYPMVDYFDFSSSMEHARLKLGYRKFLLNQKEFRGHEFHYSTLINEENERSEGKVLNARDVAVPTGIFHKKNVWVSYMHFYWGESIDLLTEMKLL